MSIQWATKVLKTIGKMLTAVIAGELFAMFMGGVVGWPPLASKMAEIGMIICLLVWFFPLRPRSSNKKTLLHNPTVR